MTETHPFGNFVPPETKYLILGSFTGKRTDEDIKNGYDWFYGTKRSQFWPIMEAVYGIDLKTKPEKQNLFTELKIAITDIIISCDRKSNSNLDMNLTNIVFNTEALNIIFGKNKIEQVFFSSRFVENLFRRNFKDLISKYPNVKLFALPSPSPRYAAMSKLDKIKRYKELLPKLKGLS